jgi:hypothetical protein
MSPVKYDLGFLSQKTEFFIVTAVKTSNRTKFDTVLFDLLANLTAQKTTSMLL